MLELIADKKHDEARQGEAFAPFALDTNTYKKHFYIESYGCAMNFADSEVVASILLQNGFGATKHVEQADLILINTCSIREKAEDRVRKRLTEFRSLKRSKPGMLVGVLGCMAERLKAKFIEEEKLVDMVIGPDAYRSLPSLIEEAETGQKAVNVLLSRDETYADIAPIRLNSNGVTAFVSIMRGCNNMCSFCVVPFTRGRERSRDAESIINECTQLFNEGYSEVTLLGQNVDSYHYVEEGGKAMTEGGGRTTDDGRQTTDDRGRTTDDGRRTTDHRSQMTDDRGGTTDDGRQTTDDGRRTTDDRLLMTDDRGGTRDHRPQTTDDGRQTTDGGRQLDGVVTFAKLLERVALISPLLRVRFSTSHPKDITDDVLYTIAKHENICNYIHLPVQSGSTRMLQMMNRTYSREWYIAKVDRIRELIPDCGISTDMISGFCTETEEDHRDSLSLMEYCKYDLAYLYFYSERPGTLAARRFTDDVPLDVKKRRLQELVDLYREHSLLSMQRDVGKLFKVLAEGDSKKDEHELYGRADNNKVVVFPKGNYKKGDYVMVKITSCTAGTLLGEPVPTPSVP